MNITKIRGIIISLSFLAFLSMIIFEDGIIVLASSALCILVALVLLYRNLAGLTDLSIDNPKIKTLQAATIFNAIVFTGCVLMAFLIGTDRIEISENGEKIFAACIVSIVILFVGNIAPKLPFSKHTGLRLPWTVTDEETWIVAHRILGYVSLPLAILYIACISTIANFELLTLIIIILWIGIPGGLSFLFYLKKMKGLL